MSASLTVSQLLSQEFAKNKDLLTQNSDIVEAVSAMTKYIKQQTGIDFNITELHDLVEKLLPALEMLIKKAFPDETKLLETETPAEIIAGAIQTLKVLMEHVCFMFFSHQTIINKDFANKPFSQAFAKVQSSVSFIVEHYLKLLFGKPEYEGAVKVIQSAAMSTRAKSAPPTDNTENVPPAAVTETSTSTTISTPATINVTSPATPLTETVSSPETTDNTSSPHST